MIGFFSPGPMELICLGVFGLVIAIPLVIFLIRRSSQPVDNLLPCPDCGHRCSPRATTCPSCGRPLS